MKKWIIAIDPGKNGAIAVLDGEGGVVDVMKMPDTAQELLEVLKECRHHEDNEYWHQSVCYLEKVGGMPGQGGSAMFSFGRGYGHVEMALLALEIPTNEVSPQKWQKHFGAGGSSITKSSAAEKREHKNKLKAKAQQLFPMLGKKVTLATCDALLIAEYGRKQEIGK